MVAITVFRRTVAKRVFNELGSNLSSTVLRQCGANVSEEKFLAYCSPTGTSLNSFFRQLNTASAIHEKSPLGHSFRVDLTETEMKHYIEDLIDEAKSRDDAIASIPLDEVTVENVLFPTIQYEQEESPNATTIFFPQNVHTEKAVRDKATEAFTALSKFEVERSMRVELFQRYKRLKEWLTENNIELHPEHERMLNHIIRDFKRNGLDEDNEIRLKLTEIQTRISELCIKFNTNLAEDNTKLNFKLEDLEGMEENFLIQRKQEDGTYELSLKPPDVLPIMINCKVPRSREIMDFNYWARCKEENTKIIEELIKLRAERASLLGYDTHADYILEIRMAQTKQIVNEFLQELRDRLEPVLMSDIKACLSYKQADEGKGEIDKLTIADFRYYQALREKNEFEVDHELLKDYFPIQKVVNGALDIYQTILDLNFSEVEAGAFWRWHDDVRLFSVTDKKTGSLIGHFYLDLYPREGKYGHFACFGLQAGGEIIENGTVVGRQNPASALVCNFPRPTDDSGGVIRHSDVVTFFHEFGHVMHDLCGGHNKCARFSGTRVERDFVETPSQMLENWAWKPDSLKIMSGHHKTGEPIPKDLMEKLCASKDANCGLFNCRQLLFAIIDQLIHTSAEIDSEKVYQELCGKIFGIDATPGTNLLAGFAHLTGGYDAQYYSYLWSKVYSSDMFSTKFSGHMLLQPGASGLEYRKKILEPGGTRDAADMIFDFLGRKPKNDAFMEELGLNSYP